ncbi:extracellular solute-binding protein [Nakamurella endophytica]|uniref:ABC transporter substrate-binding protein n=1 Tax=Nakamurella endophytica TaxID=1748367 RepID=A0A917WLX7_9ACTN|nr:extracellular solute-binding protein [Nakamurella endophytica]GGM15179.1 ABC transporter substrate-binding protein [Nakamurella endophytica]
MSTSISILAPSYADSSKSDWETIISGYNKLYPNVKVNLQIEAWDGFTDKVQTRIQGNDLPDILNDNNYADYVKNNLLYPITDVMSPATFSSIVPSLAANGKGTDGKQWAAPDIASARIMVYNTQLFQQAGVSTPPKTWDELLADAQKIQKLGNGISGYGMPLGKEEAQVEASLWIWGNKGDWVDSSGKITANSPANVAAFDEMKKFIDGAAVQPNPGATNRQAVADLFNQGKLGMYITHPGLVAETRKKFPNVKFELAPVPSKDGTTNVSLGVTDFIVAFDNKDDSRKQATKAFLDYMYSPEVYQKWAAGTGLLPVTEGAIKLGEQSTPENKPFYDALPNVKFLPQSNPNWSNLQNALQANGGEIATKSGQETLDDIQAQVDAAG